MRVALPNLLMQIYWTIILPTDRLQFCETNIQSIISIASGYGSNVVTVLNIWTNDRLLHTGGGQNTIRAVNSNATQSNSLTVYLFL